MSIWALTYNTGAIIKTGAPVKRLTALMLYRFNLHSSTDESHDRREKIEECGSHLNEGKKRELTSRILMKRKKGA